MPTLKPNLLEETCQGKKTKAGCYPICSLDTSTATSQRALRSSISFDSLDTVVTFIHVAHDTQTLNELMDGFCNIVVRSGLEFKVSSI
jgi:hypothetical protein